ncbi:hypothetical protein F5Y16DRAFT_376284 [Xylariaceae sp. FL0255]|nr:hypothetical protein F5Y16DRAFT_376284 [Xylariaceae sp. FL0255]
MDSTSPNKRRALAPLDVNTRSPLPAPRLSPTKLDIPRTNASLPTPSKSKRVIMQQENEDSGLTAKKRRLSSPTIQRVEPETIAPGEVDTPQRPRSPSVEDSSVCDTSTMDNTQVTSITEPDAPALAPAPPVVTRPRSMTREEARQKTEILRLRLGLASYKVKTNQTNLPLERLQIRPLPLTLKRTTTTATTTTSKARTEEGEGGEEEVSLPPLPVPAITRSFPETRHVNRGPITSSALTSQGQDRRNGTSPARKAIPAASIQQPGSVDGPDHSPPPPSTDTNTPDRQLLGEEDEFASGAVRGLLRLSQES